LISVSEATDATIDLGQVELHRCGVERWRANGWPIAAFEQFAHTFAQTLPEAEKRPAYDRDMVPTPGRIAYQRAFGIGTGTHAKNPNRARRGHGVGFSRWSFSSLASVFCPGHFSIGNADPAKNVLSHIKNCWITYVRTRADYLVLKSGSANVKLIISLRSVFKPPAYFTSCSDRSRNHQLNSVCFDINDNPVDRFFTLLCISFGANKFALKCNRLCR
jgi:hypothetical protein